LGGPSSDENGIVFRREFGRLHVLKVYASFVSADIPAGLGGEQARHVRSTHAGASGWARGEWEAREPFGFQEEQKIHSRIGAGGSPCDVDSVAFPLV